MENYIVIVIVAAVLGVGVCLTVKHFRGEGGCCGRSSYRQRKKRLSGVRYQKTFIVNGMHCAHCKSRVEECVNDMPGVAGRVSLKRGELVVSYADEVDDAVIVARIERAQYTVTEIRDK